MWVTGVQTCALPILPLPTIRAMALFFSVLAEWLVMVGAGISVALLLNQVVNGGSSTFLISMAVGMPLVAVLARRFSSFFEDQS